MEEYVNNPERYGIPRGYPSKNLDRPNIIFFRLSDEKTQQLAKKLFDFNK